MSFVHDAGGFIIIILKKYMTSWFVRHDLGNEAFQASKASWTPCLVHVRKPGREGGIREKEEGNSSGRSDGGREEERQAGRSSSRQGGAATRGM